MKFKINNKKIQEIIKGETIDFPKYSTQLMNIANQNSKGTAPKVVGQLSDLIQEFKGNNIAEWENWYIKKNPSAIYDAVNKIYPMIENFKQVISKIDKEMIEYWVKDLVITKTFIGLKFQEAILKRISEELKTNYRLALPNEESKGIDGVIGNKPVSIKPISYKTKLGLNEKIDVPIVYYDKKKDGINIEYNL